MAQGVCVRSPPYFWLEEAWSWLINNLRSASRTRTVAPCSTTNAARPEPATAAKASAPCIIFSLSLQGEGAVSWRDRAWRQRRSEVWKGDKTRSIMHLGG